MMIFVTMKWKSLLILFVACMHLSWHPFYVSVMEVEYQSKTKEVGISIKTFPDDMEEAIRKYAGKKIDIAKKENAENGKLLESYIKQHITFTIDKKQKAYTFLGYEIDKEALWIYFSIANQKRFQELQISTDLMYEYKSEQTNIVHVRVDGKEKSYRLLMPEKNVLFNYSGD